MTRKLVVDRETVKTLRTGVPGGRLRDVHGGLAPSTPPDDPSWARAGCSSHCVSITIHDDQT
jgi:hypothetical protein